MSFTVGTITLDRGAGGTTYSAARSMTVTNNGASTVWFKLGFDANVLATHADTAVAPSATSDDIQVPGETYISIVDPPVLVQLCQLSFLERFHGPLGCY